MHPTSPDEPDMFFPERGTTGLAAEAQRICMGCPVRRQCRTYGNATGSHYGIWGGENKDPRG